MTPSQNSTLRAPGLSDLHLAVISGQTRRVLALLGQQNIGELINARDVDGATPLMTAVLTGRLHIARLLLQNGAAVRIKDRKGRAALHYSKSSFFKKKLLTYRRAGFPPLTPKQHRQRTVIARILRFPAALESCRRAGRHPYSKLVFYKDKENMTIMKPDSGFRVAKTNLERATAGYIVSESYPGVKTAAASGWQANERRGENVLDNAKYLRLVQDFASVLKFKLTRSPRDNNGKPLPEHSGRFVASHAEKKLAVFWITAALKALLNTTDLRRIHELRKVAIPRAWREARIFLDHEPCDNCWGFLHQIKQATGVKIYVESRPFLGKGDRKNAGRCQNCSCDRCKGMGGSLQAQRSGVTGPEEHDEGGTESVASEETRTNADLEVGPDVDTLIDIGGFSLHGNNDNDGRPQGPQSDNLAQPQQTAPKPPKRWKHFISRFSGFLCAKPVIRPVRPAQDTPAASKSPFTFNIKGSSHTPALIPDQTQVGQDNPVAESPLTEILSQSSLEDSTTELPDPVSTISGRSAFFATPDPRPSLEVRIPRMSFEQRAQYDQVSDTSGAHSHAQRLETSGPAASKSKKRTQTPVKTIQRSVAALNLRQFLYSGHGSSTASVPSPQKMVGQKTQSRKMAGRGRIAKSATKGKKSRARVSRDEKLRARSTFARAVEQHQQRRRAGNA